MNSFSKLIPFLFLLVILVSGCTRDQCTMDITYTKYTPVYMSFDEMRTAVQTESIRKLKHPGKIYFKDNFIFINEYGMGIHVYDNTSPSAPAKVGFINIPGNTEIAIKGVTLYANSHVDLVAINISDPANAYESCRIKNVFPYQEFVNGVWLDESRGVLKEWNTEEVTETTVGDCNTMGRGGMRRNNGGGWIEPEVQPFDNVTAGFGGVADGAGSSGGNKGAYPSTGIAGSMAGFALYEDYLYAIVDESDLKIFNVSDPSCPQSGSTLNIGWGIETLFPYDHYLFIGTQNGMLIYDATNAAFPTYISEFEHVTSCDPVVVQDDIAYITLRSGNNCWGFNNQLDIVDLSSISSPQLIESHQMFNPHGLGIDSKTAFICDGDEGLKVYDVNDPNNIDLLYKFPTINAVDVIPLPSKSILLMIGKDGFYQYDYSNLDNISLLSVIKAEE